MHAHINHTNKTPQLADWDFRHAMLRLYDEEAAAVHDDATTSTKNSNVPFDGLLDYWPPLAFSAATTQPALAAARLLTGVGSELVGANAFMAVEVFVNGREVSVFGDCVSCVGDVNVQCRSLALLKKAVFWCTFVTVGHAHPRPPRHGRAGQRAQHRGRNSTGAE